MWEAFFAFHIRTASLPPELLRRSVVQRAVRAFAVVLPPPVRQRLAHIVQGRNQLVLRHSSRSLPLKLSTWPFCIGLPGSMLTSPTFQSSSPPPDTAGRRASRSPHNHDGSTAHAAAGSRSEASAAPASPARTSTPRCGQASARTVARPLHAHQLAGRALAQPMRALSERHILSQAGKLHPFFLMTVFCTSPCRLSSATSSFRRRFSSSNAFSRCASATSIPPYFCFHW